MNVFVGNLSHQATEKELHALFAEYGEVRSVKIISDNFTRRSKGFAFVEMAERAAGEKAVEKLNNTRVHMQAIVVNEARPKSDRSDYSSSKSGNRY